MSVGFRITLLYIVLLVGRVPEIAKAYLGTSLYQIFLLNVVLLALVLISGVLLQVGSGRIGAIWIAFHLWILFTIPFSGYRRGSVETLQLTLTIMPGLIFVGGFLSRNTATLRKGFMAYALGGVVGLIYILRHSAEGGEDRLVAQGTFENSNLLAIYLVGMMPVWSFFVKNPRFKWITRLLFLGCVLVALSTLLKTGSRSGFLSILLLGFILLSVASLANKAKFVFVMVAGVFLMVGTMSSSQKSRIFSMFSSAPTDEVAAEAESSSMARRKLLEDSIVTTLHNPVVGVGFGVGSIVIATEKEKRGERSAWQVTHNMYTQISSELGIPGLILYLTGILWNMQALWRARRSGRRHAELAETGALAGALLCCWAVALFNGLFTSMALDFWIYILSGFSIAISLVCENTLRRKAEIARYGGAPLEVAPVRSNRFFPAPTVTPAPVLAGRAVAIEEPKNADAPWRKTPRKYPPQPGAPSR